MTNKNNKLDKNDSQIVQLKPQTKQIASALALASCGLFASNGHATELAKNIDDWKVDAALMYYGEQDRVQAIEAIGTAQKNFGDDSVLDLKLVVDSLTGASASGAVAQSNSQTFTRPSGNGQYTVAAGETPLDDTFHDTRVQANANWSQVLNPDWKVNGGVYASKEFDYMSMGINAGVERGFNKDNTTLFLGTSYSFDVVDPVGGRPVALSTMAIRDNFTSDEAYRSAFDATRQTSSDNKQTADLMLGITQSLKCRRQ